MVWIHLCDACDRGDHGKCEGTVPSEPPGSFVGRLCRCPCKGNSNWNKPTFNCKALGNLIENMAAHKRASADVTNLLPINDPPKKIHLKP